MWRLTLATAVLMLVGGVGRAGAQAPAVAPADAVTFTGTVLLPDGQPAGGARVVTTYMAPLTGNDLQETTADAAGKFTLTVEGVVGNAVAALLPGHPLALAVAQPGQEITLRFGDKSAAFSGMVCDQHGKPVAGAQVGVALVALPGPPQLSISLVRHDTDYLIQTTTGPDGRFSLPDLPPAAMVQYVALAPGLAQSRASTQLGHGDQQVTLVPEATLAGRVTRDGQPVPGVLVTCWVPASGQVVAVTAADGTYRLAHLGAGPARLMPYRVPDGYAAPLLPLFTLQTGDHLTGQDFTLTPGALLTGKVTAAGTGAAVAGANVFYMAQSAGGFLGQYSAQTDATGVYHLRIAPGQGQLMMRGGPPDRRYWNGSPDMRSVTVAEGDTREGLDFTLNPPPTVHGLVLRPDGQPAAGARVFSASGYNANEIKTDAAGKFAVELPGFFSRPGPPEYSSVIVAATLSGYALGWATGKLNEELTVRLGDKPVAFSGTVTDAQGKPVGEAQIGLQQMTTGDPRNGLYLGAAFPPVTTGPDGQFSFAGLPAGVVVTYDLTAPGYAETRGQATAGTPDLKLALAPEATITGTVTAGGQPVAGVQVRCWSQGQNGFATTGADGTYRLGGLGAGTFTLIVQGQGFQGALPAGYAPPPPVQVTLQTGDHLTGQDLALARGAQVTGKVTAGGQPVAGVQVMASSQNRDNGDQAMTGADGTYRLDHLSAGTFILTVQGRGPLPDGYAAPAPVPITLQAGDKLTGQDLALVRGALLTGKVTEAGTGKTLAGEYVYANQMAPGAAGARAYPSPSGTTDANGVFRLWVAPGKWQLNVQGGQADHSNWRATQPGPVVEVAEGDHKEGLDLTLSAPPHARGKVLLADGTPAAGVLVGLTDLYGRQGDSWEQRLPNKTGPDGSFDVELGPDYAANGQRQIAVLAMQPDRGLIGLAVVADPALLLEVRLAPGAFITAQVSDPHDQPLAGVHVGGWWYLGQWPSPQLWLPEAVSDAQGHLKVGPLPAGTVNLNVSGTDEAYMLDPAWPGGAQPGRGVQIEAGVAHELPPLRLDRAGRTVSGSVLDADGHPVVGAVIIAQRGNNPTARSDARGLFTITGLAMRGPVWLAAVHPTQPLFDALVVDPDQGNGAHFTLQALGNLKGQIVDADGKPAVVNQARLETDGGWWDVPALVTQLQQARGQAVAPGTGVIPTKAPKAPIPPPPNNGLQPDAQGRWHVDGLIAGLSYTLRMWGQAAGNGGQVMAQYPNLQVKPGETTDTGPLALKPQPNAWPGAPAGPPPLRVKGRVLRPDGQPAAGALIGVSQPYVEEGGWPDRLRNKVAADGSFTLDLVAPWGNQPLTPTAETPVRLIAVLPDAGLVGWAQVTDPAPPVTLNVTPGAFATVHITDPQGRPVAGVAFQSWWYPPGPSTQNDFPRSFNLPEWTSNAQGNVKFGPLPEGTLVARTTGPDASYVVTPGWANAGGYGLRASLAPGEVQALPALQVDRAGRTASGVVVDAQGNPVVGAVVVGAGGRIPVARTDAHGAFTIEGLPLRDPVFVAAVHPTQTLLDGQKLDMTPGAQARLVLRPPGTLTGQVVNAQGQPLPGTEVMLQPPAGDWGWWNVDELAWDLQKYAGLTLQYRHQPRGAGDRWLIADQQGRWQSGDLFPGHTYTLRLILPGGNGATGLQEGHAINPGEVVDVGQIVVKAPPPPAPPAAFPAPPPAPGAGGPAPKD